MQKLTNYKQLSKDSKWYLVDAKGIRLGRLAAEISKLFLDKSNPAAVDYMNSNVHIVVLNTDFVDYHPTKGTTKIYSRHSGYPGGLKQINLEDQIAKDSREVIRQAVSGMLPKNKLRDRYVAQLHLSKDTAHKYDAQKPLLVKINTK